ncbi:MAG: hypothetical protein DIU52_013180 [bacterium]|jgi:hypothetical protein
MPRSSTFPQARCNPCRLVAIAVLGLFAAACASDSPVQPHHRSEHQLLANRSAARCTNVQGTPVGTVLGVSELSGDLVGQVWAYQAPVAMIRGQAIHLQTFHHFDLGNGDWFQTEDSGVQAPVAPPVYRLNNRYTIVRGEGAYANASGFIQVHGTLVFDFKGQHPDHGKIDARYHGSVCT